MYLASKSVFWRGVWMVSMLARPMEYRSAQLMAFCLAHRMAMPLGLQWALSSEGQMASLRERQMVKPLDKPMESDLGTRLELLMARVLVADLVAYWAFSKGLGTVEH